jgi:hypothetical protein
MKMAALGIEKRVPFRQLTVILIVLDIFMKMDVLGTKKRVIMQQ